MNAICCALMLVVLMFDVAMADPKAEPGGILRAGGVAVPVAIGAPVVAAGWAAPAWGAHAWGAPAWGAAAWNAHRLGVAPIGIDGVGLGGSKLGKWW